MYPWLVYLHILGVFGFLLAHGASAGAAFALRNEQEIERIRALLMLSAGSYKVMYPSLLVIVLSGTAAGFQGAWWKHGWIWVSLGLLVLLVVSMTFMGSRPYNVARKAAGLPYFDRGKIQPPEPPTSLAEVTAGIARVNPMVLTLMGFIGIGIIAWFMRFKPF